MLYMLFGYIKLKFSIVYYCIVGSMWMNIYG